MGVRISSLIDAAMFEIDESTMYRVQMNQEIMNVAVLVRFRLNLNILA